MKLFTAEGFSFALQITSLILLIGYSVSNSKSDLPEMRNPKLIKVSPSYFKIQNKPLHFEFPILPAELLKS